MKARPGKLETFGAVAFVLGIISLVAFAVLTFKNESAQGRWLTGIAGAILILAAIADWIDLFDKLFGKKNESDNSTKIEQKVEKGVAIGSIENSEVEIKQSIKDDDV